MFRSKKKTNISEGVNMEYLLLKRKHTSFCDIKSFVRLVAECTKGNSSSIEEKHHEKNNYRNFHHLFAI